MEKRLPGAKVTPPARARASSCRGVRDALQAHPEEEASRGRNATPARPATPRGCRQGPGAGPVGAAQPLQVRLLRALFQHAAHDGRGERRQPAPAVQEAAGGQAPQQVRGALDPAQPQPGRQDLGEGAEGEHAARPADAASGRGGAPA